MEDWLTTSTPKLDDVPIIKKKRIKTIFQYLLILAKVCERVVKKKKEEGEKEKKKRRRKQRQAG